MLSKSKKIIIIALILLCITGCDNTEKTTTPNTDIECGYTYTYGYGYNVLTGKIEYAYGYYYICN